MKVISIVSDHKAGNSTLLDRLVVELSKHGPVGMIKQAGADAISFTGVLDKCPDNGSEATIVVTPTTSVEIVKHMNLKKAIERLSIEGLDFAVVEGFEDSDLPKIAIGDVEAPNIVTRIGGNVGLEELLKIAVEQPEYVTLDHLIARIRRSPKAKEAGAIGTFTGIVRELAEGERTEALEFESFDSVAKERIRTIEDDLKKREGILEVLIYHKTGRMVAGEDIVFIVILSGHREELFPALKDAIERVKAEVPIWKKEHTVSGDFWVHDVQKDEKF
jgi:molybdopterin synthase catalytic subunit